MTAFDVSSYVIPTRRDSNHGLRDLVEWLNENVGEWDEFVYNRTSNVVREGQGWSIRTLKIKDVTPCGLGFNVISWHCSIEDEQKATLIALKWIK